jgi:hypothetical protein
VDSQPSRREYAACDSSNDFRPLLLLERAEHSSQKECNETVD